MTGGIQALTYSGTFGWMDRPTHRPGHPAVHPRARRQGLGRQVCGFLLAEALRVHEVAALMVDEDNDAAVRLYRSLGLRYQSVGTATFTP
jgi:GNAT superfamily N-acetyltransferase